MPVYAILAFNYSTRQTRSSEEREIAAKNRDTRTNRSANPANSFCVSIFFLYFFFFIFIIWPSAARRAFGQLSIQNSQNLYARWWFMRLAQGDQITLDQLSISWWREETTRNRIQIQKLHIVIMIIGKLYLIYS